MTTVLLPSLGLWGDATTVRPNEAPAPLGWVPAQTPVGTHEDGSPKLQDVLIPRADYGAIVSSYRILDPTKVIDVALFEHIARIIVEVSQRFYERCVRDLVAAYGETLPLDCVAAGWFGINLSSERLRTLRHERGEVRTEDVVRAGGFIDLGVEQQFGCTPALLSLAPDSADPMEAAWASELAYELADATRPYQALLGVPMALGDLRYVAQRAFS